ncbi:MAG: hypothetical protein AB7H97_12010 [Pseudobdellovibrionaceae bacterium]
MNSGRKNNRRPRASRAVERLACHIMLLMVDNNEVRITQGIWDIRILKINNIALTYCRTDDDNSVRGRPCCLTLAPTKHFVLQVAVKTNNEETVVFYAESTGEEYMTKRIFERGAWQQTIHELAKKKIEEWKATKGSVNGGDHE